jgi:hypothetical protein
MQAPAISYYIHVQNNATKISDSDQYSIGVKPVYPVNGKLELDIKQYRAAGTVASPTAYFTNTVGPVYGYISLVADGKTVYNSSPRLFNVNQTAVNMEWKTLSLPYISTHKVKAEAHFYGMSFVTQDATVTTFAPSKTISITKPASIDLVTSNGTIVATPVALHSSFKNDGTMRYKVTSPDGTCVIGGQDNCLVKDSTYGLPGQIKSITLGDQIYRVRYSGPNDSLERFSITSVDPILGQWGTEIDSDNNLLPAAHAMEDVFLKITYRATPTPFVSETS